MHENHELVGKLYQDHNMVRNVTYESLWDKLGIIMSDIMYDLYCMFCTVCVYRMYD